ncbi:MAG: riboflavin synthase subunit alpha [Steroidobacteraceae bacterium]|nr:riboflavin synthase [Steroidobacteraceae bacterium]
MFTGIIQDVGTVAARHARGGDVEFVVAVDRLSLAATRPGDSIAVDGVCLTATRVGAGEFAADVSRETLAVTTLGQLPVGARVNLEPALRAGDALGGHLVSGHVDGVAEVLGLAGDARSVRVRVRVPAPLARYIARKGSVALDGVSLTVNGVDGEEFDVNLVPHTQAVTTLGDWAPGRRVNLEVDQVARYVERLTGR